MNEPTWTTKAGVVLKVSEMTESHIRYALSMLRRQGCVSVREYNDVVCNPPCFQGEQAQYHADACFDSYLEEHEPNVAVDHFEDELRRRDMLQLFPKLTP